LDARYCGSFEWIETPEMHLFCFFNNCVTSFAVKVQFVVVKNLLCAEGRAGRTGASISLVTRSDWGSAKELIAILEEALQVRTFL